jgi:hypothetical protein
MEKPRICGYDCYTGKHTDREMTDEEFADWSAQEPPTGIKGTDETPSAD